MVARHASQGAPRLRPGIGHGARAPPDRRARPAKRTPSLADMTLGGHARPPRRSKTKKPSELSSQKRNSPMARTNTTHLSSIRKGPDSQVRHDLGATKCRRRRRAGEDSA